MSFSDQKDFLHDICPFCELDEAQLEEAIREIEIGFYPQGTTLIGLIPGAILLKSNCRIPENMGNVSIYINTNF